MAELGGTVTESVTVQRGEIPHLQADEFYGDQILFFSRASVDGRAAQQNLRNAKVAVLGAHAIGSQTLVSLADSGVGSLWVLDAGVVTEHDLPGHTLLAVEDVGRSRAEALSMHIGRRNPYLSCEGVSADITSEEELTALTHGMDCALVCLDSPAPVILESMNRVALQTHLRWIAGQVYQGVGLIGPTVIPLQSPCYKCYEFRRNANLADYEEIMRYESRLRQLPSLQNRCVAPRPLTACIGGFLALEAVRLITGLALPQTAGRILRLDFFAPEMSYHRILRLPNCPACGYGRRQHYSQPGLDL
jgi:bacteriocin biosynthesis cyclodehydratase domain-containing protein